MEYGIWTLIPVLFVIAFALKTKRTLEPLIFGTLLTYVITSAARIPSEGVYALSHIATDWMDAFFRVATDYSHHGSFWCARCSAASLRCWENPMEHWDLQGRLESSAGGQGPP